MPQILSLLSIVFDKLSDKENRLKIALQVSKLASSPIVMSLLVFTVYWSF